MKDEEVKFMPLLTTADYAKIAFIKSLLEAEKVNYYIDNENAALLADATPQMTVMVLDKQYKLAEDLVKDVK